MSLGAEIAAAPCRRCCGEMYLVGEVDAEHGVAKVYECPRCKPRTRQRFGEDCARALEGRG